MPEMKNKVQKLALWLVTRSCAAYSLVLGSFTQLAQLGNLGEKKDCQFPVTQPQKD